MLRTYVLINVFTAHREKKQLCKQLFLHEKALLIFFWWIKQRKGIPAHLLTLQRILSNLFAKPAQAAQGFFLVLVYSSVLLPTLARIWQDTRLIFCWHWLFKQEIVLAQYVTVMIKADCYWYEFLVMTNFRQLNISNQCPSRW